MLVTSGGVGLKVLNVAVPLALLGLVWAVYLRQRRLTKAMRDRLDETSDVCARLHVLSDALETELFYRGRHAPVGRSQGGASTANPLHESRPTLH